MIIQVKERTITLINQLLEVWEDSVRATHLFLYGEEINNIKEYVPQALKVVSHLLIIENKNNETIAFMGIEGTKLEMLFVKNSEREFYEHMGFRTYKRSNLDEQGNPYPILYMKLER